MLIKLENVSTVFGKKPKGALEKIGAGMSKAELLETHDHVLALNNISLEVEAGEIFVIMGLSGSGKSTLARHINRLIDPTSGKVFIDGVNILELKRSELIQLRRRRLAMVFQRFGLMPHRTVIENIAYGLEVRGIAKPKRMERARDWMMRVGLDGYAGRYPHELSGGMQQRVGLARALVADTDIIIMDEPFSALDPLIRSELQDELARLHQDTGKTIVFITHDFNEALRLGSRLAILKDGEVVQSGTAEDILLKPANAYVEAFARDVNKSQVRRQPA